MPAARPTKATVTNALCAIVAAGLTPGAVVIGPDGSFRVVIAHGAEEAIAPVIAADENAPVKFGDL